MPSGVYKRTKPAWNKGMKGLIPWNKGTKGIMKAWNKGKKLSKEHCEALSKSHKGNPGFWTGKKRDENTKKKISDIHLNNQEYPRGENHWNWKGGKTRRCQHSKDYRYRTWRSAVFERDNWTCQTCGVRGVYLEAHHIKRWVDYPELRYIIDNGVSLCRECHELTFKVRR